MKRVLFILLITVAGAVASFSMDAFFGVLLYTFYAFASPIELTYGALTGSRLSFIVAAIVITSALMQRKTLFPKSALAYAIVFFVFFCWLSLAVCWASTPSDWGFLELLVRIAIMALIAAALIDTPERLRVYIFSIGAFSGVLGAYYGFGGLLAGSEYIGGAGRIGDNNGYAVWLNTSIPIIYYAGLQLKKAQWRYLAKLVLLGNILAVLLTFSRGGFITLVVVLFLLFISIKRKWLVILSFLVVAAAGLVVLQGKYDGLDANRIAAQADRALSAPDRVLARFRERIETLRESPDTIATAASRMHFWGVALNMATINPLFGVGFNRYQAEYNNYDTSDGEFGSKRAVHNTALSLLSETGYTGFTIFVFLVGTCLAAIARTKRLCGKFSDKSIGSEFIDYCRMLYISLVSFFLGGFFVNAQYQEMFWAILTITIAIHRVAQSLAAGSCDESVAKIREISQKLYGR